MQDPRDLWTDEDDRFRLFDGFRSPRRREQGGIVYATALGAIFVFWGLKMSLWPSDSAIPIAGPLLVAGSVLLVGALGTFLWRRRRDADGRWG